MEPKFRSLLVATDGHVSGEAAVEAALSLAACCGGRLVVLGVVEPPTAEQQAEGIGLDDEQGQQKALRMAVEQAESRAREIGISAKGELLQGDPEHEIERYVREHAVDLVVVGHRHVGRVRRWLEGSTGEHLLQGAGVSVLVVR